MVPAEHGPSQQLKHTKGGLQVAKGDGVHAQHPGLVLKHRGSWEGPAKDPRVWNWRFYLGKGWEGSVHLSVPATSQCAWDWPSASCSPRRGLWVQALRRAVLSGGSCWPSFPSVGCTARG